MVPPKSMKLENKHSQQVQRVLVSSIGKKFKGEISVSMFWLKRMSWQSEWCASSGVMHHPQTARFNWFTVCMCSKTTPAHRLAVMTAQTHTYWYLHYISLLLQYIHAQMGYWTVALCGKGPTHTYRQEQAKIHPQILPENPHKHAENDRPRTMTSLGFFSYSPSVGNGKSSSAKV